MDERRETVPGVRFDYTENERNRPSVLIEKYFCSPCLFFSCEVCFL